MGRIAPAARPGRVMALAAVCACAGASPARAAAPSGVVRGPYGRGAAQVWLVVPRGPVRSVVVFAHGWKTAPPSASYPWVGQFRPWLDHLAARGNAVVFPRYQLGGDAPGPARAADFERGVALGLARLRLQLPVVAIGYSYGASLVLAWTPLDRLIAAARRR